MRVKLAFASLCMLIATATGARFPLVSLIFEYSVGSDGTRQNIRMVKIEEPVSHRDLSSLLTAAEKARGIQKISKRKRLSTKEAGHKLYEVALFDLRTHRYITDE